MSTTQFTQAERANHPVARLCRVLGVSRSGFYAWQGRPPSARPRSDRQLATRISEAHEQPQRTYGAPRIHAVLVREGTTGARKRATR